jgi:hypothetical protein
MKYLCEPARFDHETILAMENGATGKPTPKANTPRKGKEYRREKGQLEGKEGPSKEPRQESTLVTIGALFDIELISGDAKDVVALDANAVDEDLRGLGRLLRSLRSARRCSLECRSCGHSIMSAKEEAASRPNAQASEISGVPRKRVEKWINLLIDFRLTFDRHRQSASKFHQEIKACPAQKAAGVGSQRA